MSDDKEPKQRTEPQKPDSARWDRNPDVEPVDIPVPKRSAWDRLLRKVSHPKPDSDR